MPKKDDFIIDALVIGTSVIIGILLGWTTGVIFASLPLVLFVDAMLAFALGSVSYYTAYFIKEKRYGTSR